MPGNGYGLTLTLKLHLPAKWQYLSGLPQFLLLLLLLFFNFIFALIGIVSAHIFETQTAKRANRLKKSGSFLTT